MLRDAVHRYGRVFQFGTQQRSSQEFRQACEIARNGRLGKSTRSRSACMPGPPSGRA